MADEYSCCAPWDVKRTLVTIGDATIGLAKPDMGLEELYNSGRSQ